MWTFQSSARALFGALILIAVFDDCIAQVTGGYQASAGGYSLVAGGNTAVAIGNTAVAGGNAAFAGGYTVVAKIVCPQGRIYFPQNGKCYRAGQEKGPCGELMTLVPSATNENIGVCQCRKPTVIDRNYPARPLIFVEELSRCYPLYHQGPCRHGDWLVVGRGNVGACERIPCSQRYFEESSPTPRDLPNGESIFVFAIHGRCFTTGDPCDLGDPEKKVFFNGLSLNPVCERRIIPSELVMSTLAPRTISNPSNLRCGFGESEDIDGACFSQTIF